MQKSGSDIFDSALWSALECTNLPKKNNFYVANHHWLYANAQWTMVILLKAQKIILHAFRCSHTSYINVSISTNGFIHCQKYANDIRVTCLRVPFNITSSHWVVLFPFWRKMLESICANFWRLRKALKLGIVAHVCCFMNSCSVRIFRRLHTEPSQVFWNPCRLLLKLFPCVWHSGEHTCILQKPWYMPHLSALVRVMKLWYSPDSQWLGFVLFVSEQWKRIRLCSLLHYLTDISAPASQWKFMSSCQMYQPVVICHWLV